MRWVRSWMGAVLWAFGATGTVGLLEALSQWLRFGQPDAWPDGGVVTTLLPAMALYGWVGLITAGLVFPPAAVAGRFAVRPRLFAFSLAVGAALALVGTVYFGYLIHDTAFDDWWTGRLGPLLLIKMLAGLLLWWPCTLVVRRLAVAFGPRPGQWVFVPVVLLVVTSAQWPSWREQRMAAPTSTLARLSEDVPPAGSPNVLILSIDALRADHVGCLDPSAPPTPHLDALAAEGLRYDEAWAVSSWTLPNVGTFLTGQPPRVLDVDRARGLPEAVPTLAEVAWRHGWRTGAVVTNPYLGAEFGFRRGFQFFDHAIVLESLSPAERSVLAREATRYWVSNTEPEDAGAVMPKALAWLDADPRDRPFFLWIHIIEPHLPYRWHAFPDDAPDAAPPEHPLVADDRFMGLQEVRDMLPDVPPDLAAAIRELYRREVRQADRMAGVLLDGLRGRGLLDDTLVVVLADHGEEFFEHGGFEHGHTLMPEVTRIPLIVRLPDGRGAGTLVSRPATLLDLVPTLCREAGWTPPAGLPGSDGLWPARGSDPAPATAPLVLENMLYGPEQQAWWAWPWLKVENPAAGSVAWFDLAADPGARAPLAVPPAAADSLKAQVRSLLDAWDTASEAVNAHRGDEGAAISDQTRRQLESLGY